MLRPFRFGEVRTTLRTLVNSFHRLTSFNACLPRSGKLHVRWAGIRPIFSLVKSVFPAKPAQIIFAACPPILDARKVFTLMDARDSTQLGAMTDMDFRLYRPSLFATIFSTLKLDVEPANAISALYAIASNGLRRYPKHSKPFAYENRKRSGPSRRH